MVKLFHSARDRSNWSVALAIVIVLASPALGLSADMFVKSSVNLPASLTAFEAGHDLDGDGLNDAVAIYQRRIMLFFQTPEGKFSSAPDIEIGGEQPVPSKYSAVSLGKVTQEAGTQLLLIGSSGVDAIGFSTMKSGGSALVAPTPVLTEKFEFSEQPELTYLNCVTDMNGDGRPEIVLPQDDKLLVFSSSDAAPYIRTGSIPLNLKTSQQTSLDSEPLLLGSAFFNQPGAGSNISLLPQPDLWHSVRFATTRFTQPLLVTDYNRDQRMDLLGGDFLLQQDDNGDFQPKDSRLYSRILSAVVPHESRNILVPAPSLVDFNGDKVWDTYNIQVSAAKLSPRTDVSVYLGSPARTFATDPTQVLRTRDFAYSDALPVGDVNGDGAMDLALFHLDFQPSSMQSQLKAYLRDGLDGDLRFYLWDKQKNQYPESPSFKQPVTVSYEIYGARQFFRQQVTINRDMTGDELPDLVLKTGGTEFSVFENQGGRGFSRSPLAVISTAPTHFSSLQTLDLNQDGKGDVVISGYLEDQDDRIIYSLYTSTK